MSLTIITVAYNSGHVLPGFVRAAAAASPDSEIIVVDNASSDGGVELVRDESRVRVLLAGSNLGFGRACNLGAQTAASDTLLFMNPDSRLSRCDLPQPRLSGLNGGVLLAHDGSEIPALRPPGSACTSLVSEVLYRLRPRGLRLPRFWAPRAGFVVGTLLAVDREEFLAIGGFDSRYFLYHEDRDLGKRYRKKGHHPRRFESLQAVHARGASSTGHAHTAAQAWSFVSAVEYVGIWDGLPAARRYARAGLGSMVALERVLRRAAGNGPRDARLWRKAEEFRIIRRRVADFRNHLPPRVPGFYPHAADAIEGVRPYLPPAIEPVSGRRR